MILNRLVTSFADRLRMLVAAQRHCVSQCLSSNSSRTSAPDDAPGPDFRSLSIDEYEVITTYIYRLNNKSSHISQMPSEQISRRGRFSVEHRANWLPRDTEIESGP
jgi:hypothetical protein